MTTRKGDAISRALAAVRRIATEHATSGRDRLPTIKVLARRAGVASFTMWKAVQRLVDQGVLDAAPRRGIAVLRIPDPLKPECVPRRKRWEQVHDSLRRDLARGVFRPGDLLPQPKHLLRVHGTTHRTLAKALRHLVDNHLLEPHGRTHRVPVLSVNKRNSRVVLIAFGIGDHIRTTTPRTQDHVRALEQACARSGAGLEICSYRTLADEIHRSGRARRFGSKADQVSILGFIVWNVAIVHNPELFAVLRRITRTGKPLAFLDEVDALRRRPLPADLSTARTFTMATSALCGEVVGRYLYSLGHRRVAAIVRPQAPHSELRAMGVVAAMRAAGVPDAVHIVRPRGKRIPVAPPVDIRISTTFGPMFGAGPVGKGLPMHVAEQRVLMESAVQRELLRPSYEPVFERALDVPGVSAWVADNDAFALDALAFLHARGVRVPHEISLIGFDNSLEASFSRLSSYDFNGVAVTDAMLAYLLAPNRTAGQSHAAEIEGFVAERATTATRRPHP